jgi:hypothetical protein
VAVESSLSLLLLLLQFHGNEAEDARQISRDDLQFVTTWRTQRTCLDLHWCHFLHCKNRSRELVERSHLKRFGGLNQRKIVFT